MKERNGCFTPFNHGYLCQMLRSANDEQLANVLNDVSKEQERRNEKKEEYLNNIRKAISDAVAAGFGVDFYYDYSNSEGPSFTVHSNNEFLYGIELFTDN